MFDVPPTDRLDTLIARVDALASPIEGVFVAIGDELVGAIGVLKRLETDFASLSSGFDSERARDAEREFGESIAHCGRLSASSGQTAARLSSVGEAVSSAARPIQSLRKILVEVGALAINAKIQAIDISASFLDFTVFTTEIDRLHRMAEAAVSQAASRLIRLGGAIAAAQAAEADFQRRDVAELANVQVRLERGIAAFAQRRRRSREAMAAIGARSGKIAQRVSDCITQMQINDLTRQRMEHVRDALALVRAMQAHGGAATCPAWTIQLDEGARLALAGAICRLQAEQLGQAAEDFAGEVARMRANMHDLAGDAAEIMREAADLFAGVEGGGTFLSELQGDVDETSRILDDYAAANVQVHHAVIAVMDGFADVAADIDTIHSIDADMRIMGLNASLKCGRLGDKGRALGVVARELRGCSRRTQESSDILSAAVANARESAGLLAEWVDDSHAQADALRLATTSSMHSLSDLGASIHHELDNLTTDCGRLSRSLGQTAGGISIHHHVATEAGRIVAELNTYADAVEARGVTYEGLGRDIGRLLEKHYTMDSERVIHGIAEGGGTVSASPDECDMFFL